MMIGFGIDFRTAADVQAFVERVAVVLEKQADDCVEPLRAAGIRDAVATMRKAAETAGMVDHGAGLGVPVMTFDAVVRNGRVIVPAMTFAGDKRLLLPTPPGRYDGPIESCEAFFADDAEETN